MALTPMQTDKADDELEAVLASYLRAVEEGRAPDRMELLAQHPELASDLAAFFAGQDRFGRLAAPLREAVSAVQESAIEDKLAEGGRLGDFRLIHEIGRGGMGIVYEAEQITLGRRVALKVLPFASTLDAKQLQRFKNEAQAAAQLHHTNIVPVHATGCERGVHYYAMQFIEGRTLAALIRELRQREGRENRESSIEDRRSRADEDLMALLRTGPYTPELESKKPGEPKVESKETGSTIQDQAPGAETVPAHPRSSIRDSRSSPFFRTVAQLGIQAADALEHAHQMGVIHRDIKPANLLVEDFSFTASQSPVTTHSSLRLWITDFGLAHCQSQAGLTMTGDLVGTLRYMSPEQALAKRVVVDHRTDIYSLGATLYELLTLEPAFGGADRQELLRQIAFEEPRPLRRRNKTIPVELETIVLKAMEKNPGERYSTAQELADDLRRFLEDKPIRARRPSLLQRARKLARRHPGVAVTVGISAVLILLLAVLGLTLSNIRLAKEKQRAEAGFRMARDTVDRFFTQVGESPKLKAHGMEKLRKEMLQNAKEFYERFIGEQFDAPLVRHDLGLAHVRLAKIHQVLGDFTAAQASSETAIEILGELARGEPNAVEYRGDLAASYQVLGGVYSDTGRREKAKSAYHQALAIQERLADDYPREPEYRRALAETHIALGLMHSRAEELEQGIVNYEQALDILRQLVSDHPGVTEYRSALAAILAGLGDLYKNRGWYEKSEAALKEAASASQRLADDHPDDPDYRFLLGLTQWTLGLLYGELSDLGQAAKAEAAEAGFQQALLIFEKLAREHPDVPDYVVYLGSSHFGLGYLVLNQGKPDAAQARFRSAIEIFERVLATEPRHVEARMYLRRTLIFKVMTLVKRGDHAQAIQDAEGVASQEGLISSDMYNIACIFSQSATAAANDTKLQQSERTKLKEQYAGRAIDFLHQAVAKGFLNLSLLETDLDLIPLRSREDFQKLVRELKEKTKSSRK